MTPRLPTITPKQIVAAAACKRYALGRWKRMSVCRGGMYAFARCLAVVGMCLSAGCAMLQEGGCEQESAGVFRDYFAKKLEPKNCVLHGAGQSPKAFDEYSADMGESHQPMIYMFYLGACAKPEQIAGRMTDLKSRLEGFGHFIIPQIGLHLCAGGEPSEARIAQGEYDTSIDAFCVALKELNRPAFVRIGYEFNGSWNGYKPETYIAAWKRIVNAMRAHQLDEVATVWCYCTDLRTLESIMDWYPGDDWVDWWGIDLFSAGDFASADTVKFMRLAREHGFPVMIGESTPRYVGVLEGERSWNTWFAPYFDFILRNPNLKAFCYINWNWADYPRWHNWGDARIRQNGEVLARYRQAISDPIFAHAREESAARKLFRVDY